uniref:Uncharacterized protein n=1 Tax=Kalanchoe fedtschenkoi TaxID=63787 RepID=A0A7N0RJ72_KALFE
MASTCLVSPPMVPAYSSSVKVDLVAPASFGINVNHHALISVPVASKGGAFSSRILPKKWVLHSTTSAGAIADLTEEEKETWESCRQALSSFNFEHEEEDKILGKAFGQLHSPYWGEERAREVPEYKTVTAILNYLSLTLTDEDLAKLLKKFPEVLGCSLEDEVKNNVALLEKEWGIAGKQLRNLLLRNPKVLGYNVDCKGSCVAQCTRCWVRF